MTEIKAGFDNKQELYKVKKAEAIGGRAQVSHLSNVLYETCHRKINPSWKR